MTRLSRRGLLAAAFGAAALTTGGSVAVARSNKLGSILAQAASNEPPAIGFRQGTLLTWDPSTGNNTVELGGQEVADLPVLTSGSLALAPGDVVALLRFGTTYFILGAIRNAGGGSLQSRAARVDADEFRTSTAFGDLDTVGPTLEDVFIGSSRQCLVLLSAKITNAGDFGVMSFEVSGASSIPADDSRGCFGGTLSNTVNWSSTVTDTILLTAEDGLRSGLNTFTAKYKSENGANVEFQYRRLVVIPF